MVAMRKVVVMALVFASFMWTGAAFASTGTLVEAVGQVEMLHAGKMSFAPVAVGQVFRSGDILRTGDQGKAKLLLEDGSTLTFAEETEFQLGSELARPNGNLIGTLLRGVARAVLNERAESYMATPTTTIGIRGTDVTITHRDQTGFFFLDEGKVDIQVAGQARPLDAGHMTASYVGRNPLPPTQFVDAAGLRQARQTLSGLTSMSVPPSLQGHADLNEILARWVINYAHYLADAEQFDDAETALLIASDLTTRHDVESEIQLQIGGLYFYRLNDAQNALRAYVRILQGYRDTPQFESALFGTIRCFYQLGERDRAHEYAMWYRSQFPHGKHIGELDVLAR